MGVRDVPRVDVRVLGPLSVAVDGRTVAIGSPKQRAVLAMLVLRRRVSLDALAEELWRETPPASVAATVHTLVSRLRRTLAAAGSGLTIAAENGVYVMDVPPDQVDVHRFHELAAQGRAAQEAGSPAEAARRFRQALALWRGPALADLADRDFARVAAVRLDESRIDVAEDLAEAELAAGRPAAALDCVEDLTVRHPFRERLRGLQMLSLYRLGRQAEALAAYQDLRRTLADELGLEPTSGLQVLERQILQQSPELDQPSPAAAVARSDSYGTLAFLFTDIEGSVRLWEGDRAAMAADLARHDAVLKDAVAAHHGRQFAHTGDGLGAAFPTVADALGAAIAGQRELSAVAWRGAGPLRVRMAVHAGTAEARAGTFLGPNLNRTARLLDLAGGGQILCSQAAVDLGQDELPAGARLLDLGERRLEGLSRPERVWQVTHPDLPEPAAVRTAPVRRQEALTSFVGREAELAELTALLRGTRLLTISGVGGAGKTRLALELAARVDKQYADGARIVELATVRDDRPLADDVLSALGAGGGRSAGLAAEDQLCQALGDRQLLLVLDNCEHVLDAATALVDTVLRRCPAVTVLATSREVLSVPGETTWAAPGLSLPPAGAASVDDLDGSDAAALFAVRARTARPGFGPSPANAGAISRICHRLDGIPLAVELAAARVRVLGVPELADRLDDRLRLLTSGPRSAPARHQTLRAAMDWSFDLLSEAERRLLRRLAVFPQSFDLDAAAAVSGGDADPVDVLDLFARLIDKSLLVPEGIADTGRFRLLETVRQYAAEKLAAAGESDAVRDRHRRHFVGRILAGGRAGTGFFEPRWAQHVALDDENYNAALTSGLDAGDLEAATVILAGRGNSWFWGSAVPSAVRSIDPDALVAADPSPHVSGLLSLGGAGIQLGRWTVESAVPIYERALAIAEQLGTPADEALACFSLGYVALSRGDRGAARMWLDRALRGFADDPLGQYYVRHELGWIELTEGNTDAARRQFESILTVLELGFGSENPIAHLRASLALCEAADGHVAGALTLARKALDASRQVPLARVEVMALIRASEVAALSGEPIGAELVEALHLLRRQGGLRWVAAALTMAAVAHEADGRPDTAARLLGGAGRVAGLLAENVSPIAPLAAVVDAVRHRIDAALGTAASAAAETAGARLPVPAMLDLALDGLTG